MRFEVEMAGKMLVVSSTNNSQNVKRNPAWQGQRSCVLASLSETKRELWLRKKGAPTVSLGVQVEGTHVGFTIAESSCVELSREVDSALSVVLSQN